MTSATNTPEAYTEAAIAEHSGFMAKLEDPTAWVLVAFVLFFVMFGRKMFKAAGGALDSRSDKIRHDLEEARRLREEAETVLATYRKKYNESMQEAEEILARARNDANRMVENAEKELKVMLESRTRMARDKIAQAEKQAVQEVRDHVIDITVSAAKTLIIENLQHVSADELVKQAIADIERKVH